MLKHLYLNKKKIPVPVPIQTLADAIGWVEEALLDKDHSITKVELDGSEVFYQEEPETVRKTPLSPSSRLFLQSDSPFELALQTTDALRTMISVMERGLKPLAVNAWQTLPRGVPDGFDEVLNDVGLLLALMEHALALVEDKLPGTKLREEAEAVSQTYAQLQESAKAGDWRQVARLLLTRLEGQLARVNAELGNVQKDLFDWQLGLVKP